MGEALLVMVAGGVGAVVRFLLDTALGPIGRRADGSRFPVGIVVVNVLGSLALGMVLGLGRAGVLAAPWPTVLGVGFCGGFTTFSTAAVDAARMCAARRWTAAALQWLGMLAACVAVGALGLALTSS